MLRRESVQAAYPLANKLSGRGLLISPAANTPIAVLVGAVLPQANLLFANRKNMPGMEGAAYDAMLIEASKTPLPDETVVHDSRKAEFVDMAKNAISSNLYLARSVVTPKIKAVIEEVNSYVDGRQQAKLNGLSIEPIFYSSIWDTQIPESLCGRFRGQFPTDMVTRPLGLPPPAEWTEILSTGLPTYDSEINKWIGELDQDALRSLWEEVFGLRTGRPLWDILNGSTGTDMGRYGRLDAALVVFLAARHLGENLPASVNLDLTTYRQYMAEIAGRAGQAVLNQVANRANDLNGGPIVVSVPRSGVGSVYVLGDNYNAFLQAGGTPEAVLGAATSGRAHLISMGTDPSILRQLEESWATTKAMLNSQLQSERRSLIIQGLRIAINRQIVESPDEDLAPNIPREVFVGLMNDKLKALQTIRQETLWFLVRDLVCDIMYAHTDVKAILTAIDIAGSDNPGLPAREAALLGTIAYVAEWVVSQCDVGQAF